MSATLVGYDIGDDAHPGDSCDEGDRIAVGPGGEAVTLRRFDARSAVAGESGPPVQVLLRAAGPHVEAVLDIGTAPNGDPVLVLPRLPWSLGDLLAARHLSAGEAVTVLVPVVQTVARLHAAGVAHRALAPGAVRFDRAGTPVLTGFDAAVLAQGAHDAKFEAAVAADVKDLGVLMTGLLERVSSAPSLARPPARAADPEAVVDQLFRWADPEPVLLPPDSLAHAAIPESRAPGATPGRLGEPRPDPARSLPAGPFPSAASGGALRRDGRRASPAAPVHAVLRRLADSAGRVRRRVWITAGAALVLLVVAIVLLPGRGAEAEVTPVAASTARRATVPSRSAVSAVPVTASPVRAAALLLARREACLTGIGTDPEPGTGGPCLSRIEVPGSPVAVLDAAALTAGVEPVRVPPSAPVVRAVSGTTATIGVGRTTILIVRQGDSWRVRDIESRSG